MGDFSFFLATLGFQKNVIAHRSIAHKFMAVVYCVTLVVLFPLYYSGEFVCNWFQVTKLFVRDPFLFHLRLKSKIHPRTAL